MTAISLRVPITWEDCPVGVTRPAQSLFGLFCGGPKGGCTPPLDSCLLPVSPHSQTELEVNSLSTSNPQVQEVAGDALPVFDWGHAVLLHYQHSWHIRSRHQIYKPVLVRTNVYGHLWNSSCRYTCDTWWAGPCALPTICQVLHHPHNEVWALCWGCIH